MFSDAAFTRIIAALVALGFTAWASVVWFSGQTALRVTEINQEKVIQLTQRVAEVRDMVSAVKLDGVSGAAFRSGQEAVNRANDRRIDENERRIGDLEKKLERMPNPYNKP